jgi:hypothetical protein
METEILEKNLAFCRCLYLKQIWYGKTRKRMAWINYMTQVFWVYCNKCGGRRDGTLSVK